MISEEAERKKIEALEAEKHAKEVARKKALEMMEAERKAREELITKQHSATPEEMFAFFGKQNTTADEIKVTESEIKVEELVGNVEITEDVHDLDELKKTLLSEQEKQGMFFDKISEIAEQKTGKMSEVTKAKAEEVAEAHKKAKEEQESRIKNQKLRAEQEKAKAEKIQQIPDEKQKRREKVRAERLAKVARKRAERARKVEDKERIKQVKKERAQEKARLIKEKEVNAEMGGGIVNIKGLQISTELNKVPHFSLFNFGTEIKAREESKN